MAEEIPDIPDLLYFQSGNIFSGNLLNIFRYKIIPKDNELRVSIWKGPFCMEKSEILAQQNFSLDQSGLAECKNWIIQKNKEESTL